MRSNMKALQIFHACLAFSCVATFVAHQKYERLVEPGGASRILDVAVPQSSYAWKKMMRQKIQTPLKEYVDNAKPESDKIEFVWDSKGSIAMNNRTSPELTSMTKALECLRQTKPDLSDLSYPKDAHQHFLDIHEHLGRWVQTPNHKPHRAAGYRGPWIENRWISHFEHQIELKNSSLPTVFGPYIPLLIPWTDIWVRNRYAYPKELAAAMKEVLRDDVLYITVNQNADGFVGRCTEFSDLQNDFHITVLSAGGYGHVPIPLLKQPEKTLQKIPLNKRKHLISYVGKNTNAPNNMREKMIAQKNHFYYYGKKWRDVMAQSKFSLCPRGYGRTSYHVMEALQMGLIPIQVYQDQAWLPYGNLIKNISFSVTNDDLPNLITQLSTMPDAEIAKMEERIEKLKRDYFTFEGVLKQISMFMLDPTRSELVCQAIPSDSGSREKKPKSCKRPRRRRKGRTKKK